MINTCSSVGGGGGLALLLLLLFSLVVLSVGHLMIVKRFEIEIGIKDRGKRFPTICIKV
jgi:hypothetical protein